MYKLSTRSYNNMVGMHPYLSYCIEEAIKITKQDFGILDGGGVRTKKEQLELYAQGRTKPGSIVTWTKDSRHTYGLAADLVAFKDGKPSWDEGLYDEIARAMKTIIKRDNLPINWGFDLWGKDKPHWQITKLNGVDAKQVYDAKKFTKCFK